MSQTAIVTGGASGIGRHTCLKFAEDGYNVVVADVRKDPREGGPRTHEKLKSEGREARFWGTDVRDWDAVQEMVEQVLDWYGSIDVLVNNAGVAERAPIAELPMEDARDIFRINVDGVYHGMKAVVPVMTERGDGAIVNVASGAGKTGIPGLAAYCGSKAAVIRMSEAVAAEVEHSGVTVDAVCPGRTRTAMTGFEGVPPRRVADTIHDVATDDRTGRAVDT
ncbi:MAG: SDR family oxidoreductase [Candidatus Nanohaloarchaea archaeon]|nr:SDR family oxidoreductase [Candidatus Nanohaloarchaea archaeon]